MKKTGNWVDDLGSSIEFLLKLGLVAMFAIPISIVIILVLTVILVVGR